jgi:hypothetical protein
MVTAAMGRYCEDVRAGAFPEEKHCYRMLEGEEERFAKLVRSGG